MWDILSGILGFIFVFGLGSLMLLGLYSEFKDSYDYGDTWGTIKYGGILLIIICAVFYGIFSWYNKYSVKSEFKPYINSYINIIPNKYNNSNLGQLPKIVIVDKTTREKKIIT